MKRPFYSFLIEVFDLILMSFKNFKKHKMLPAYAIALALLLLAIVFVFVSFIQTISPFVYPLF